MRSINLILSRSAHPFDVSHRFQALVSYNQSMENLGDKKIKREKKKKEQKLEEAKKKPGKKEYTFWRCGWEKKFEHTYTHTWDMKTNMKVGAGEMGREGEEQLKIIGMGGIGKKIQAHNTKIFIPISPFLQLPVDPISLSPLSVSFFFFFFSLLSHGWPWFGGAFLYSPSLLQSNPKTGFCLYRPPSLRICQCPLILLRRTSPWNHLVF